MIWFWAALRGLWWAVVALTVFYTFICYMVATNNQCGEGFVPIPIPGKGIYCVVAVKWQPGAR